MARTSSCTSPPARRSAWWSPKWSRATASRPARADPLGGSADTLAARWAEVRARVDAACRDSGRDPAEAAVLPVSKNFGPEMVREAAARGLSRFGENKVQELREKTAALADLPLEWGLIGYLQTNKARDVARLASDCTSLDRLELAEALHRRLEVEGRTLDVLVQVKTSSEETKHGLPPDALPAFLERLPDYPTLRVRGLMPMAVQSDDAEAV